MPGSIKPNPFTIGGTVPRRSLYVSRRADDELFALCRDNKFAYVLAERQVGKSSLMVRTAERLSVYGTRSVIVDLSHLVTQVTTEQWYLGILVDISDRLSLKTDVFEWWQQYELEMNQRLIRFFKEVLLREIPGPVVLFFDEIDTTIGLPFTADFFKAIRSVYGSRPDIPEFQRLSFVLIGVALPTDLGHTLFNIGRRVELTDFTLEESLPLAEGFELPPSEAMRVMGWVLKWTDGHPYLTQHLCHVLVDQQRSNWSEAAVDETVDKAFFKEADRNDNLLFVRDMLIHRAPDRIGVLLTYRNIRRHRDVRDDAESLIKSHLKLSGIVKHDKRGALCVRNAIYYRVFDERWIKEHLRMSWIRRLWHSLMHQNI